MDRWTALSLFRRAAELGSFAATARDAGVSPAAVGKNVSELEAHLGVRLFHRTTRRMSLSDEGAVYYERVARLLDELAAADAELGARQERARGLLRVSAPVTLTLTCFSPQLPVFLRRHPEVELELELDDRRVDLIAGRFDLAVRGSDDLEDSSLIARRLVTLDHVLCTSPAYVERHGVPRSPEDLRNHQLIRFSISDHAREWELRRGSRVVRVPVRGCYAVNSSLAVRDALRGGFGMSLVPRVYVQEDLDERRLVPVLDDWSGNQTTVYAVYPSKQHLVPKVRAFVDFLVEAFASVPPHAG